MNLLCWLRGHRLRVDIEYTPEVRKVWCSRCRKHFGMHDGARAFLEWDAELEEVSQFAYGPLPRTLPLTPPNERDYRPRG